MTVLALEKQTSPNRDWFRMAINPATTSTDPTNVAPPESGAFEETQPFIERISFQNPESALRKDLWRTGRRPQSEQTFPWSFEASDEQLGTAAELAATATLWPEFLEEIGWMGPVGPPVVGYFAVSPPHSKKDNGTPPTARTELGKRLREIRRRIVASGVRLLDWDEVDREVQKRRGGPQAEDER